VHGTSGGLLNDPGSSGGVERVDVRAIQTLGIAGQRSRLAGSGQRVGQVASVSGRPLRQTPRQVRNDYDLPHRVAGGARVAAYRRWRGSHDGRRGAGRYIRRQAAGATQSPVGNRSHKRRPVRSPDATPRPAGRRAIQGPALALRARITGDPGAPRPRHPVLVRQARRPDATGRPGGPPSG